MSQTIQQRAILVLVFISIVGTTLPFAIPSTDFALRVVTAFALYAVWFLLLTQALSTRRRVVIGLGIASSALMTMAIALPPFVLVLYLLSMMAIFGAILVALTLPFSERL